jgi:hypothetical protein
MNGAVTSERERAIEGVTRLGLADGPLLRPVLCRVVSMVLTRADWPLDRLEDALLVCDALCVSGSENGARLTFSLDADEHEAELRVCELTPESAERLLAQARLPLVGNVLEQVAERVSVQPDEAGSGTRLAITLSAR